MTTLADHVRIERRFQRSIRLDADVDQLAPLQGYVLQTTAAAALETTLSLRSTGQGAFTWTGPYGGGKSSLALALTGLLSAESEVAAQARALLGATPGIESFTQSDFGEWLAVPVTGRRADPLEALRESLEAAIARAPGKARTRRPRERDSGGRDLIERLQRELDARPHGGVMILVDELGKFLEASADGYGDVHIFQDVAELANRSEGRLLVIGILHQAFERYAYRLGVTAQEDWAKIQGRFVDVPLVAGADEVIDLVGQAIQTDLAHAASRDVAVRVADRIKKRRLGTSDDLAMRLDACWPLHPVTAALLGPVSRRRFGQNERSVFGLLTSAEPKGVGAFLAETPSNQNRLFGPAELWDYLKVNLEPAILASPDGHRWASAADVVERAYQLETKDHVRVAKTVALIDLFSNGSGIVAEPDVIATCLTDKSVSANALLDDLVAHSVLIHRRHLGAYAIHAGSDFDIEQAVAGRRASSEELDVAALNRLANLRPVLAKAHHHRTGTPRWFEASLVPLTETGVAKSYLTVPVDAAGAFRLVVPRLGVTGDEAEALIAETAAQGQGELPVALGLPPRFERIRDLGREFVALGEVRDHDPMLDGDAIARREVMARLAHVSADLEEELRLGFEQARWYIGGEVFESTERSLSAIASQLADTTFSMAPVIQSELVNRQRPSSNTVAAFRTLLQAMVQGEGKPHFGIEGYPAERGLASTVFEGTGLYIPVQGKSDTWAFADPGTADSSAAAAFAAVWREADQLFAKDDPVSLATLFQLWESPPFGIRRGVMPLLAVAYILTRRTQMALYLEGLFQPTLDDLLIDRLLQNPADLSVRLVKSGHSQKTALKAYAAQLEALTGSKTAPEPLPIAQALVEFAFGLPNWSQHARGRLSPQAVKVRQALLHAHDPHRLLDNELPAAVDRAANKATDFVCAALVELDGAYGEMLRSLSERLLSSLKHRGDDLSPLRQRAQAIAGEGGNDLKLRNFISRLAEFDGSVESIADICGLVAGLPVSQWRDLEPGRASVQIADFAYRFRRIELFGDQRDPTQTAVMVMAGVGEAEKSVVRRAQISLEAQRKLQPVVQQVTALLDAAALDQDHLLAVLAEVAQQRLEDDGEADVTVPLTDEGIR